MATNLKEVRKERACVLPGSVLSFHFRCGKDPLGLWARQSGSDPTSTTYISEAWVHHLAPLSLHWKIICSPKKSSVLRGEEGSTPHPWLSTQSNHLLSDFVYCFRRKIWKTPKSTKNMKPAEASPLWITNGYWRRKKPGQRLASSLTPSLALSS